MEKVVRFVVKHGMGKDEEISIITQLHHAFAELGIGNSYLIDLFNQKLLDWVTSQIKDDFPPDVMEFLDKSGEVRIQEEEIRKLRAEIQELLDVQIAKRDMEIQKITKWYEQEKEGHAARVQDLSEMGKNYTQLSYEGVAKDKEIAQLKQTIIELKAKLYDLTNKGE